VDQPPEGKGWIHEVKFDGYRSQIVLEHGRARVFTRRGHDWTDKYGLIAEASVKLRADTAIIDGEIIVTNDGGITDFPRCAPRSSILRGAWSSSPSISSTSTITICAR
jgi:ATP-dependent DNA ligase